MKFPRAWVPCLGLSLMLFNTLPAQARHDPLTQAEIDQLRDTAQEPDSRLHLYLKFARDRLNALDQARSDPKVTDHAQQTHDHLQAFVDVYDELNDNIDTYADQRQDIRKVLKAIIEADTEFQARLRALKDPPAGLKEDAKAYEFVLSDALDDVDSSEKDHVQLLGEQEEAAKHKRLLKAQPPGRANLPPQ